MRGNPNHIDDLQKAERYNLQIFFIEISYFSVKTKWILNAYPFHVTFIRSIYIVMVVNREWIFLHVFAVLANGLGRIASTYINTLRPYRSVFFACILRTLLDLYNNTTRRTVCETCMVDALFWQAQAARALRLRTDIVRALTRVTIQVWTHLNPFIVAL